jgi:MinD-like ATPase involved in chromosome partitioning or flagellar assembly
MKPKEVEGALERRVRFEVPSDGGVPLAVNRGNPLVLSEPRSAFSKAVREMAKAFAAAPAPKSRERRRMFAGRS